MPRRPCSSGRQVSQSSFSLGWGEEPVPAQRAGRRARTPPGGSSSVSLNWGHNLDDRARAKTPPPRYRDDEVTSTPGGSNHHRSPGAYTSEAFQIGQRPAESANRFASGAQQNVGNFLTGRPTTRVHQTPGGSSSFSLAWGEEAPSSNPRQGNRTPRRDGMTPYSYAETETPQSYAETPQSYAETPQSYAETPQSYAATPQSYAGAPLSHGGMDARAGAGYREVLLLRDDCNAAFQKSGRSSLLEDSPGGQVPNSRGRGRYDHGQGELRGASLPDSDSDAEQSRAGRAHPHYQSRSAQNPPFTRGGADDVAYTPGDVAYTPGGASEISYSAARGLDAAYTPGGASSIGYTPGGASQLGSSAGERDAVFGQRMRESGNSFANGSNQNVGNFLTDRPSTRVHANPGGNSSLRLGCDDDVSSTPRQGNRTPRSAALDAHSRDDRDSGVDASTRAAGKESEKFDGSALRNLKARMTKHSVPQRGSTLSAGGDSDAARESAASYGREKEEVVGSRPKVWKPHLVPQQPPGGAESSGCAYDARFDGKRRIEGAGGAGLNRDNNAIHALRYYSEDHRLGKQQISEMRHEADMDVRDSHRYFLAEQEQADRKPGKAHRNSGGDPSGSNLIAWQAEAPTPGRNSARRQRTPPPDDSSYDDFAGRRTPPPADSSYQEQRRARTPPPYAETPESDQFNVSALRNLKARMSKKQASPPEDTPMSRGRRDQQVASPDDVESDICSDDIGIDMDSTL